MYFAHRYKLPVQNAFMYRAMMPKSANEIHVSAMTESDVCIDHFPGIVTKTCEEGINTTFFCFEQHDIGKLQTH
ncbi:hypothetical protein [Tateyamaria sp. syn59]|uniref:hypothetical protein n=1 Tax=Tateyamaria sp. syn59 TaxID=2576942 RepID=UPI0011BF6816